MTCRLARIAFACPAVGVLFLAVSAAPAEEPVKLQYKFSKGDKLVYRLTTTIKKSESLGEMKYESTIESETLETRTFLQNDDKGNPQFESEVKRIQSRLHLPQLGKFEYDSKKTDNDKSSTIGSLLTPILDTLNGATFTVTVTPEGDVHPIKGFEELMAGVVAKDNPLAAGYSDEAYRMQYADSLAHLSRNPVKKGDSWSHEHLRKLPGLGEFKEKATYKHEGEGRVGNRNTVKISATYEGSFDVDVERGGAKVTGKLTLSDGKGVIHFDPVKGRIVSKDKSTRLGGTLTVQVGDMNLTVESDQIDKTKVELLEKLPE